MVIFGVLKSESIEGLIDLCRSYNTSGIRVVMASLTSVNREFGSLSTCALRSAIPLWLQPLLLWNLGYQRAIRSHYANSEV